MTTSLTNAIHDFEVNARGTLNLLEAIRDLDEPAAAGLHVHQQGLRRPAGREAARARQPLRAGGRDLREHGIGESRPLDFHSPYGCSKGTADQYVIDYARTFGLPAVVFRMSCIYGPHQFGTEDQGWVAHFLIRASKGQPITIYGDGMQVRDILFADDLVDAFLLAQANMPTISGQAFNIGGGPQNTISLIELLDLIEQLHGRRPDVRFGAWRPGDQRYYVSDTQKFRAATSGSPAGGRARRRAPARRVAPRIRAPRRGRPAARPCPGTDAWPTTSRAERAAAATPRGRGATAAKEAAIESRAVPCRGLDRPATEADVRGTTMRAAVLVRAGQQVEMRHGRACRAPRGRPRVRVRVEGCGVCASNIPPWEGREWFKYPMTPGQLGHEGWGIVEAGRRRSAQGPPRRPRRVPERTTPSPSTT